MARRDWNENQGNYNQGQGYQGNYDQSQWSQPPSQWDQSQRQQWSQQVGSIPPDQFQQATTQAVQQVDPQQYQNHLQSQPIANLPQNQQSSLAQTLLSTLLNRGVSQQRLSQQTGVQNFDPRQMTPQQIASVLQYAQQNHPQALGQVATQYQNQPDVLHSILGNKALLAAAAAVGVGLMTGQIGKK